MNYLYIYNTKDLDTMKIKITQEIKDSINKLGNKTAKISGLKVYTALYRMHKKANSFGYFDCPSSYLEAVNKRYKKVLDQFIQDDIIVYFESCKPDPNDIFNSKKSKYYDVNRGICMKYKFLVDITNGDIIEVDFNSNKKMRWFNIIKKSLMQLGFEPIISRDAFGLRVHHPIIPVYKDELKDKGFAIIDAVASQPRLLKKIMNDKNIFDANYELAFQGDFYDYIVNELNLENRKMAKDLFMFWLNSSGYVPNYKIHLLFPQASKFIKGLKSKNYKDSSSYLQRIEAKIWIDDLLENLPSDFALPVHDCLIVKDKEVFKILDYCKSKYNDIDFKVSYI
jgi:predicted kinase